MGDNDPTIRGDADVEFQRVDAHGQCIGKGREGVLRQEGASAAMRLDIESHMASHGRSCNETTES
jgi:hypothetical protein